MGALLGRGAFAGAVAGLLTSVVAFFLLEPVLDRAIALEGGDGHGPVSREVQKLFGLPVGFALVGLSLGLLFAVAYRVLPSRADDWHRSTGLALGAFLALAAVPQLRYPANPPGVGDPETITTRTSSYLLAVALGVVVVAGAYAALRALDRRGVTAPVRQSLVVAGSLVVVAVGYALLPDSGDAVEVPATLVWDFRIRSLGVLALLYASLGAAFGLLSTRASRVPQAPADALVRAAG
jgi:Probable cobalt transporter subunit (CbtA)